MKFLLLAVLFIVALNAVSALPTNESGDLVRHRRVTCDLLSYGGKVNDSACAAHCLTLKKAGGSCRGGVCHCRK